jgi:hypothetical protein
MAGGRRGATWRLNTLQRTGDEGTSCQHAAHRPQPAASGIPLSRATALRRSRALLCLPTVPSVSLTLTHRKSKLAAEEPRLHPQAVQLRCPQPTEVGP